MDRPAGFSLWMTPMLMLVVTANQASMNVSDLVFLDPNTPIARVARPLLKVPLNKLSDAACAASHGRLGNQWKTVEECPCSTPVGACLQAAHKELGRVDFDTPEGLIAGLGYAITRPGHGFQFQQASAASDRSGVSGVHKWSVMLPTSARVAQEVYEPLIGIQYPMLCGLKKGQWHIGTGSIRKHEARTTGLRFVQWVHHDTREAARDDPPPEATAAVYRQIEKWLPVEEEERDNILVLTTRKDSAQSLQSFCQQSRRRTNVETAVKVAVATARHCIVLHGQSSLLSGRSNQSDFDQEC